MVASDRATDEERPGRRGRPSAADLLAALRPPEHRTTAQRRRVIEAIAAAEEPMTIESVCRALSAGAADRSTVYRILDLLERLGFMRHVHGATGIAYYFVRPAGRLHLACTGCGAPVAVDDPAIGQALAAELAQRYDFEVDLGHATIFGVCGGCRAVGRGPGEPHRHQAPDLLPPT